MHDSLCVAVSLNTSFSALFNQVSVLVNSSPSILFYSSRRGEERRGSSGIVARYSIVPAFKQDGVAFQFCPVTPPGCGSGDLDGGMGFVGPFHVHLADMLIDKKNPQRTNFFKLTTLEKIKQNAILILVSYQEEDNFNG